MFARFLTVFRWILTPFIALLLLFEEWGWEPLAALMQLMARLPLWAWCERRIARFPPWAALLTLGLPAVALFPVKLLALYFLGRGQASIGFAILIAAKIVGTAVVARLFHITEPALMQMPWFAKWYPRWKIWKDALMAQVRASAVWRMGRQIKSATKRSARSLWRRFNQ
jgi:hypothetical protein